MKRVESLAGATLGVMQAASLAVAMIGRPPSQARGLVWRKSIRSSRWIDCPAIVAHLMLKVRTAVMNGTFDKDHAAAEWRAKRPYRRAACTAPQIGRSRPDMLAICSGVPSRPCRAITSCAACHRLRGARPAFGNAARRRTSRRPGPHSRRTWPAPPGPRRPRTSDRASNSHQRQVR